MTVWKLFKQAVRHNAGFEPPTTSKFTDKVTNYFNWYNIFLQNVSEFRKIQFLQLIVKSRSLYKACTISYHLAAHFRHLIYQIAGFYITLIEICNTLPLLHYCTFYISFLKWRWQWESLTFRKLGTSNRNVHPTSCTLTWNMHHSASKHIHTGSIPCYSSHRSFPESCLPEIILC